LRGAGLGGLILGLAESLAVWRLSTGWSEAVAFIILFAFILARPSGLFGTRARV
jgi:branched-subunit amino acid ABC-type transport system permease component